MFFEIPHKKNLEIEAIFNLTNIFRELAEMNENDVILMAVLVSQSVEVTVGHPADISTTKEMKRRCVSKKVSATGSLKIHKGHFYFL